MKRILNLGLLSLAALAPVLCAAPIASTLSGDLVALNGKRVSRFDDAQLADKKYLAVYFSAHWCPPCRAFTPDLVKWYQEKKPANPHFELIFVSSDEDEKAMESYMAGEKMPWPALKFSKVRTNKSLTQHGGRGIPCLVLLDAEGRVLSHSYEGQNYVGPRKVMSDIDATLAANPPPAGSPTPATTAGPAGSSKPAAPRGGSSFDDFFKKKAGP